MKVLPLEKSQTSRTLRVPLPNGEVLFAREEDMHQMFDDPTGFLREEEKEGLLKLAIAVVFAEHSQKNAAQS